MDKYKVIKNFLTKEEIGLLKIYCDISHRFNYTQFDQQQNNIGDTAFYADYLMESLMLNKKKIMEEHLKFKVLPTYSFWRMYTQGAELVKHKDRPSCEYSVTIQIGHDPKHKWSIFIEDKEITLDDGDAVIYKGCEVEHWREPYEGDWHAQVFLHYVKEDGPNKDWVMDKRSYWGTQK
jgi:hypothetical protein